MKLSEFEFELPDGLISEYPSEQRDESRLMVIHRDTGKIEHKKFNTSRKKIFVTISNKNFQKSKIDLFYKPILWRILHWSFSFVVFFVFWETYLSFSYLYS